MDEADISRAIIEDFSKRMVDMTETDVVIVGAGPAGCIAAKRLADAGKRVVIIERHIKPGGGMYVGGMLMNSLVVQEEAKHFLEEVNVKSLKHYKNELYTADAYEVATKLLVQAFDAGAKLLNGVEVNDVIAKHDKICGVVINWAAVAAYPATMTCVDPIAFKCKAVIDVTGHQAEICKIAARELGFKVKDGDGAMWVDEAEKTTVENTKEIYPGLFVAGMAANSVAGYPRMGPIFGSMFMSGDKVAKMVLEKL